MPLALGDGGPKARFCPKVFAADGEYLGRHPAEQMDRLAVAGLAEWRGREVRLMTAASPVAHRRPNGWFLHHCETEENPRNCHTFKGISYNGPRR
jgi:hypothetical protein